VFRIVAVSIGLDRSRAEIIGTDEFVSGELRESNVAPEDEISNPERKRWLETTPAL